MGRLLQIDVVSYDGELSVDKQRRDLEEIAEQRLDSVAIHPLAINAYVEPVRKLGRAAAIPVIDMLRGWPTTSMAWASRPFSSPTMLWMGEQVITAVVEAARDAAQSDSFEIVHTQGALDPHRRPGTRAGLPQRDRALPRHQRGRRDARRLG